MYPVYTLCKLRAHTLELFKSDHIEGALAILPSRRSRVEGLALGGLTA